MAWTTPKTDWKAEYSNINIYLGDFFNVEDYNRIKNNLKYIDDRAKELFSNIPTFNPGADKHFPTPGSPDFSNDNIFADEINAIENGLKGIQDAIGLFDYGDTKLFYENGAFIDYKELNRIESAFLDLYEHIESSIAGKLRLSYRLGQRGSTIKV
ncbi:MAG: hypothetical protein J5521_03285 [Lachnospiraceae bacterium]|nr:hypothetical protein [Lachnospiraceae bacterium]MBR4414390.1 hypothetical protein [Aeriscardovia sp.]